MLKIRFNNRFKKDLARIISRGYDEELLWKAVALIQEQKPLPEKYKDHALKGKYKGMRDCHILNDWVLIYSINNDELILILSRTGTHSDLEL